MLARLTEALLRSKQPISCRSFTSTAPLCAEPPKKRRRVDPAVLRSRVERKIKKHEREIEKIQNEPRQPIPILEYQPTGSTIRELEARPGRTLEEVGISEMTIKAAQKLWTFHRREQNRMEQRSIKRVESAQQHALDILKGIDRNLYDKTVALDKLSLIPYSSSHVRKETPPIADYKPPDGHIRDKVKNWVM